MAVVDKPAFSINEPSAQPLLEIRNVSKLFDGIAAVDNVSLTINKGEISPCWVHLAAVNRRYYACWRVLKTPTKGQIILDGQDLANTPPYKRPINMMFQSYALFPHMTVGAKYCFGLKQDGLPRDEINQRVHEMLELVHMQQYAKRKPHQLSGGQRQRVALARSLAKRQNCCYSMNRWGALDKNCVKRCSWKWSISLSVLA